MVTRVRSSLDIVGPTVKVGQVTEVDKDTFWPLVKAADDKTVVLDMYTQWYILLILILIYIPVITYSLSLALIIKISIFIIYCY